MCCTPYALNLWPFLYFSVALSLALLGACPHPFSSMLLLVKLLLVASHGWFGRTIFASAAGRLTSLSPALSFFTLPCACILAPSSCFPERAEPIPACSECDTYFLCPLGSSCRRFSRWSVWLATSCACAGRRVCLPLPVQAYHDYLLEHSGYGCCPF